MRKVSLSVILVAILLSLTVIPSWAQLGDIDNSSFTVQNVGAGTANVTIAFYDDNGVEYIPTPLNNSEPNPLTLASGASFEVYVPGIPSLPAGRYSVVLSSNEEIIAIANLIGQSGNTFYNGSYSGSATGASTVYLPSITYEYYTWNSLVSVQNAGSGPTDVTVDYTCSDGSTGQHQKLGLAAGVSAHFDLETAAPSGLPANCNGSAVISSSAEPVIVVDNQTANGGGTQSFNAYNSGSDTVYIPGLYHNYYTWSSSLNIVKIGSGTAAVTVSYSDGGSSSCSLSDASPGCLLYMPVVHPAQGVFAATITSVGQPVVAIVNAANPAAQAQTYGGFLGGTGTVGLPTVMKQYYGWDTSFTCQNVGSVATSLNFSYQGYAPNAYDSASLDAGESVEVYQPGESFLPNGFRGSVTVTANTSGAEVACIVNQTHGANQAAGMGDWSMSYNAQ